MADAEARFVVTAHDATAAAFRSADRGMKQLQRSAMGMRSALASVGVILSARAFAGWIKGALDAKNMTEEQLEATKEARAAVESLRTASDDLARSLGSTLAPAISGVASMLIGLNAAFFNADPSKYGKEINDLTDDLIALRAQLGASGGMPKAFRDDLAAQIDSLEKKMSDLRKKQFDWLTDPNRFKSGDGLEMFDLDEIRGQKDVMRSLPSFDMNAPSEDMRRRAAQITAETRTELEKQLATMREADALLARGLISPETMQRLQDSMLQPIEVTTQRMKDANIERLANLVDSFKSEEQLELDRYAQRLEDLQDLYNAEIVQREEFTTLKEQLEQEHQERMTEIDRAAAEERYNNTRGQQADTVETIVSGMTEATAALANGSKRMFDLNKKFAKAEAVVNAYRAIQQVWADPTLPFYAKVAATAVTAAKTAANISAINGASFGGGTTPSAAGTATVNGVPVQQSVITVRGIDRDQLFTGRQLVELLNEATRDGAKLVFQN